jgi:hypothetical protein
MNDWKTPEEVYKFFEENQKKDNDFIRVTEDNIHEFEPILPKKEEDISYIKEAIKTIPRGALETLNIAGAIPRMAIDIPLTIADTLGYDIPSLRQFREKLSSENINQFLNNPEVVKDEQGNQTALDKFGQMIQRPKDFEEKHPIYSTILRAAEGAIPLAFDLAGKVGSGPMGLGLGGALFVANTYLNSKEEGIKKGYSELEATTRALPVAGVEYAGFKAMEKLGKVFRPVFKYGDQEKNLQKSVSQILKGELGKEFITKTLSDTIMFQGMAAGKEAMARITDTSATNEDPSSVINEILFNPRTNLDSFVTAVIFSAIGVLNKASEIKKLKKIVSGINIPEESIDKFISEYNNNPELKEQVKKLITDFDKLTPKAKKDALEFIFNNPTSNFQQRAIAVGLLMRTADFDNYLGKTSAGLLRGKLIKDVMEGKSIDLNKPIAEYLRENISDSSEPFDLINNEPIKPIKPTGPISIGDETPKKALPFEEYTPVEIIIPNELVIPDKKKSSKKLEHVIDLKESEYSVEDTPQIIKSPSLNEQISKLKSKKSDKLEENVTLEEKQEPTQFLTKQELKQSITEPKQEKSEKKEIPVLENKKSILSEDSKLKKSSDFKEGNISVIYDTSKEEASEIPVVFAVTSLKNISPSYIFDTNNNLYENPNYKGIQLRDKENKDYISQIVKMSSNLNPELLSDSKTLKDGSPIVDKDGNVISGNSRSLAIIYASKNNKDKYEKYKQYLIDNAEKFGLSKEDIIKIDNPILVRVLPENSNIKEITINANKSDVLNYNQIEQAKTDAKIITPELLEKLNPNAEIKDSSNYEFVKRFINELEPNEKVNLLDNKGKLTEEAYNRIQNAILTKIFSSDKVDNSDKIIEILTIKKDTDELGKNLINAIINNSQKLLYAKESKIVNGEKFPEYILSAINKINEYKTQKSKFKDFDDFIYQTNIFKKESPVINELAKFIINNKNKPKVLEEFFKEITDYAINVKKYDNIESLFGDDYKPITLDEYIMKKLTNNNPIKFSINPEETIKKESPFLTKEQLDDLTNTLIKAGSSVKVITNLNQIPDEVRDDILAKGIYDKVEGFNYKGKNYLVLPNLTPKRIPEVIRHEIVHNFEPNLLKLNNTGIKYYTDRLMMELVKQGNYSKEELSEALAKLAEKKTDIGLLDKLKSNIKLYYNKLLSNYNVELTDKDISVIMDKIIEKSFENSKKIDDLRYIYSEINETKYSLTDEQRKLAEKIGIKDYWKQELMNTQAISQLTNKGLTPEIAKNKIEEQLKRDIEEHIEYFTKLNNKFLVDYKTYYDFAKEFDEKLSKVNTVERKDMLLKKSFFTGYNTKELFNIAKENLEKGYSEIALKILSDNIFSPKKSSYNENIFNSQKILFKKWYDMFFTKNHINYISNDILPIEFKILMMKSLLRDVVKKIDNEYKIFNRTSKTEDPFLEPNKKVLIDLAMKIAKEKIPTKNLLLEYKKELDNYYIKNFDTFYNLSNAFSELGENRPKSLKDYTGWLVLDMSDSNHYKANISFIKSIATEMSNFCKTDLCISNDKFSYDYFPNIENSYVHIYFDKGKPQIIMGEQNNKIDSVSGLDYDQSVDIRYKQEAMNYLLNLKQTKGIDIDTVEVKEKIKKDFIFEEGKYKNDSKINKKVSNYLNFYDNFFKRIENKDKSIDIIYDILNKYEEIPNEIKVNAISYINYNDVINDNINRDNIHKIYNTLGKIVDLFINYDYKKYIDFDTNITKSNIINKIVDNLNLVNTPITIDKNFNNLLFSKDISTNLIEKYLNKLEELRNKNLLKSKPEDYTESNYDIDNRKELYNYILNGIVFNKPIEIEVYTLLREISNNKVRLNNTSQFLIKTASDKNLLNMYANKLLVNIYADDNGNIYYSEPSYDEIIKKFLNNNSEIKVLNNNKYSSEIIIDMPKIKDNNRFNFKVNFDADKTTTEFYIRNDLNLEGKSINDYFDIYSKIIENYKIKSPKLYFTINKYSMNKNIKIPSIFKTVNIDITIPNKLKIDLDNIENLTLSSYDNDYIKDIKNSNKVYSNNININLNNINKLKNLNFDRNFTDFDEFVDDILQFKLGEYLDEKNKEAIIKEINFVNKIIDNFNQNININITPNNAESLSDTFLNSFNKENSIKNIILTINNFLKSNNINAKIKKDDIYYNLNITVDLSKIKEPIIISDSLLNPQIGDSYKYNIKFNNPNNVTIISKKIINDNIKFETYNMNKNLKIEEIKYSLKDDIKTIFKKQAKQINIADIITPDLEKHKDIIETLYRYMNISYETETFIDLSIRFFKEFFTTTPYLNKKNKKDMLVFENTRRLQEIMNGLNTWASVKLRNLYTDSNGRPLSDEQMRYASMYVVADDLLKSIERGDYLKEINDDRLKVKSIIGVENPVTKKLPFGFKDKAHVERFKEDIKAKLSEDTLKMLERRKKLTDELLYEMQSIGFVPEKTEFLEKDSHQYLRRLFFTLSGTLNPNLMIGFGGVKYKEYSFLKERTGSDKPYVTDLKTADFSYFMQAKALIEQNKLIDNIKILIDKSDYVKNLMKEKNIKNTNIFDYVRNNKIYDPETKDRLIVYDLKKSKMLLFNLNESEELLTQVINLLGDNAFSREIISNLQKFYDSQLKKRYIIIEERYSKFFDAIKEIKRENLLEKMAREFTNLYKMSHTYNPFKVIKWTLNNTFGDIEASLMYPKIMTKVNKSFKDLWDFYKGNPLPEETLKELIDLGFSGTLGSGFVSKDLLALNSHKIEKLLFNKKPTTISEYYKDILSNYRDLLILRENVLRLASYRYFKEEFSKNPNSKIYGMSQKYLIDALKASNLNNYEEVAKVLARDLIGDYGNLTGIGKYLRNHLIPFYSFQEMNFRRYLNVLRNLRVEEVGNSKLLAAMKTFLTTTMVYVGMRLWNYIMYPNDAKLLDKINPQGLYLIVNKDRQGNIYTIPYQSVVADALDWLSLDKPELIYEDFRDILDGKKSIIEVNSKIWKRPLNKIFSSIGLQKIPYELWAGKTIYPDIDKGTPIRSKTLYFAKQLGIELPEGIYQKLKDNPDYYVKSNDLITSFLPYRELNKDELNYNYSVTKVFEFLKSKGIEIPFIQPIEKSNALYNYKLAIKNNDKEKAKAFLKRYEELGGSKSDILISLKHLNPITMIPIKYRAEFFKSLTKEEKERFNDGVNYWRTYILGKKYY